MSASMAEMGHRCCGLTTSLCVACASSLNTGPTAQAPDEFGTSRTLITLGLSMFVVGLGLGPTILALLSEFYGRRPVYVISTLMFVIWVVPCAVANNIATLVIARFFDGFAGAAFHSVAGGTVGDVFTGTELQKPVIIYTAAPFLGDENFRVLLIWAGIQWLLTVVLVPETYVPVLLRKEAVKVRTEIGDDRWHAPIGKWKDLFQAVILVFSGVFTFLVDSYPNYAASALAANSFARSMFAAMFPLFGPAMYDNLGYQWATFLLTMLAASRAPCLEIERLKAYIRDLGINASSVLQEGPSTSSVLAPNSSQCLTSQTSAARAAIWVIDEATGCPRYCNYSSTACVIHRCHEYLSSTLGKPALHDPFSLGLAASRIGVTNEGAFSDLISMTRLQEEHYLNLFWQSYHTILPVLHFETFTQDYNSLWTLDNSVRGDSALVDVVLALCAQYGNCFMNSTGTFGGFQAQHSIRVSQYLFDRAHQLMSTKTELLSIQTVQCHLLSAVYLANKSLTNAAHDSLAQALRNALALGFHHEVPPAMPEQDKALRRNIWWSIYTMDVRISLDLGQPFLVNHSGATCPLSHTVEESGTSLSADNLSTTFRGISSDAFFREYLDLMIAVRKAHEAFVTHCAAALEASKTFDLYETADFIKNCAEFLLECLEPVHDWTKQIPDLLKAPRRGAGRSFSRVRSPLDLEDSIPSWLQRQRVMLELSYHDFLMILHRPFIRFPSSSIGRIPISAEHSVWSLSHAIIITQIISQISTESDVLSFVHETTRILWDATVTLLAFAMAHPFCPHSPSAHAALQIALSTFDVLATSNSDLALKAAETTRKVLVHMGSIVSGFQAGSLSAPSNATLRIVNGSDEQPQKSLTLSSVAANHDEGYDSTMPPTYTSTMDLDALDLFSRLDEVLSDQIMASSAMSPPPLVDEPLTFDSQLLGVFE
ncbi:hypothetical protein KCU83_g8450, partial [Aureobasidium melanogenum]